MFEVGQKVKRKYYDPVNGYQYTECTIIELKNSYCLVTHNNRKQKIKVPYNLLLI